MCRSCTAAHEKSRTSYIKSSKIAEIKKNWGRPEELIYAHNTGKGPRDLYMLLLIWKQHIKTRGPIFKRAFLIKRLTQRISKTDDAPVSYSENIIELMMDFIQRLLQLDIELLLVFPESFMSIYIIKITKYSFII